MCRKGNDETWHGNVSTDLDGLWDGCTMTPYMRVKHERGTGNTHMFGGLRLKSSLSDLGKAFGN